MSVENIAKVSNFHLACESGSGHQGVEISVQWMALEAIESGVSKRLILSISKLQPFIIACRNSSSVPDIDFVSFTPSLRNSPTSLMFGVLVYCYGKCTPLGVFHILMW